MIILIRIPFINALIDKFFRLYIIAVKLFADDIQPRLFKAGRAADKLGREL